MDIRFIETKREAILLGVVLLLFSFLVGMALAHGQTIDKLTVCLQAAEPISESVKIWSYPQN